MILQPRPQPVQPHRFTSDVSASRSSIRRSVSPQLQAAGPGRARYRLRFEWADAAAPSGRREIIRWYSNPTLALALWNRVRGAADPLLLSATIEAKPQPRWEPISEEYIG